MSPTSASSRRDDLVAPNQPVDSSASRHSFRGSSSNTIIGPETGAGLKAEVKSTVPLFFGLFDLDFRGTPVTLK
jgi:hypothetical protein